MKDAFLAALVDTGVQLGLLVGVPLALAVAHGLLERLSRDMLTRSLGWWSVLWTGWIGVPLHEMSHLLACKVFRHRVRSLSLFSPDPKTGSLGYVNHDWDHRSRYQRAGNVVIGVSPLLGGIGAMILVTRLALPEAGLLDAGTGAVAAFLASPTTTTSLAMLRHFGVELPSAILTFEALSSWRLWLVLYLLAAISLHMSPSREDLRGTLRGLLWIIGAFVLLNLVALPFGGVPDAAVRAAAFVVAPAVTALVLALALNLVVVVVVFGITRLARQVQALRSTRRPVARRAAR